MADKIHHIVQILDVEPFKITCKWDTGEVRVNDLEPRFPEWEGHPHLHPLLDYKIFRGVTIGEDGTLQWPSVPVTVTFLGKTITEPLDLDPVTLYETSKPRSAYRLVPVEQAA